MHLPTSILSTVSCLLQFLSHKQLRRHVVSVYTFFRKKFLVEPPVSFSSNQDVYPCFYWQCPEIQVWTAGCGDRELDRPVRRRATRRCPRRRQWNANVVVVVVWRAGVQASTSTERGRSSAATPPHPDTSTSAQRRPDPPTPSPSPSPAPARNLQVSNT